MKIYEAVKYLRMALALDQSEFGKLLHVTRGTVLNWENQHRTPRMPHIKLMLALIKEHKINLTFEDFLNS